MVIGTIRKCAKRKRQALSKTPIKKEEGLAGLLSSKLAIKLWLRTSISSYVPLVPEGRTLLRASQNKKEDPLKYDL